MGPHVSQLQARPLVAFVTDIRLQKSCAIGGTHPLQGNPPEKFQKTFVKPLEEQKLIVSLGEF